MAQAMEACGDVWRFFQAAVVGDEDEIVEYIHDNHNLDVMALFDDGESEGPVCALMLAAKRGHVDCVKKLLDFGADISVIDQLFTKAIIYASHTNDVGRLRTLAVAGLYKDIGIELYEELLATTHRADLEGISHLLTSNADQIASERAQVDKLCFFILVGYSTACLEGLVEAGADVNGYNSRGFTPLIAAILAGSIDWIDCLVQRGADVNRKEDVSSVRDLECLWVESELAFEDELLYCDHLNSNDKSPLTFAVWTGKLEIVQHILGLKAEVDSYDSMIKTSLVHAVYSKGEEVVAALLSHGADVNFDNYHTKESVLFHAMYPNSQVILRMLLDAGADVNAASKSGKTPFLLATEMGRTDMMRLLVDTGKVDINQQNKAKETPLMCAAARGMVDSMSFLIAAGVDVNLQNESEETAVEIAAENGSLDCVKLLMKLGGDSEVTPFHCGKLLHAAARSDNSEMLEFCLKNSKPEEVDALNSSDETPLMCAVGEGIIANIKLLLAHGADVNCKNSSGATAIIEVLETGSFECFSVLLEEGADLNVMPEDADTPLVLAAKRDEIEFLETVLNRGSQQVNTVCNESGQTPLICAMKEGKEDFVQLLLDHGADINLPDRTGCTPLMHAVKRKMPDLVQTFLDAGADVNALDDDEITVIWDALYSPECLELILKHGVVFDDDGKLRPLHTEYGVEWGLSWHPGCLKLLFDYDCFDWEWFVYGEQRDQVNKISFAAVCAGNSPYMFPTKEGSMTSLLQEAFLGDSQRTVRYLLANLYLTVEDYKVVTTSLDFQQKVRDTEDVQPETVAMLEALASQPWRLETLSFLAVSGSLQPSNRNGRRSDQIDLLPLPELFKTKLKFQDPIHKACCKSWEELPEERDDLLSLSVGRVCLEDSSACDEDCDLCGGFGSELG